MAADINQKIEENMSLKLAQQEPYVMNMLEVKEHVQSSTVNKSCHLKRVEE